ncbi:hypothetical protein CsSME_00029065 [Camellia sinensis var. sinensis]
MFQMLVVFSAEMNWKLLIICCCVVLLVEGFGLLCGLEPQTLLFWLCDPFDSLPIAECFLWVMCSPESVLGVCLGRDPRSQQLVSEPRRRRFETKTVRCLKLPRNRIAQNQILSIPGARARREESRNIKQTPKGDRTRPHAPLECGAEGSSATRQWCSRRRKDPVLCGGGTAADLRRTKCFG